MPYKLKKSGSGFKVGKKNGSKTFSKKPMPKGKATAQMRAIYANTKDESFDNRLSIALMETSTKSVPNQVKLIESDLGWSGDRLITDGISGRITFELGPNMLQHARAMHTEGNLPDVILSKVYAIVKEELPGARIKSWHAAFAGNKLILSPHEYDDVDFQTFKGTD